MLCKKCKFWTGDRLSDKAEPTGECKRKSPSMVLGQIFDDLSDEDKNNKALWPMTAFWPITFAEDFCGDFVQCESKQ